MADNPAVKAGYVRWFSELSVEGVVLVGGKNASLGEMYRQLAQEGMRVPNGFAVTAAAYRYVCSTTAPEHGRNCTRR